MRCARFAHTTPTDCVFRKLTETVCDKSTKRLPWFHLDEIAGGDGNAGDEVEG